MGWLHIMEIVARIMTDDGEESCQFPEFEPIYYIV